MAFMCGSGRTGRFPSATTILADVPVDNQALLATGWVRDNDPRIVQMWSDGSYKSEQWTGSLRIAKELASAKLLSLTSYRRLRTQQSPVPLTGTPIPMYDFGEPRELDAVSQEFRYVSDYSGPFNFAGGVFLYYANKSRDINGIAHWERNSRAMLIPGRSVRHSASGSDRSGVTWVDFRLKPPLHFRVVAP